MICPDREAALNALLDDELDPPAARALAAHVATCPGCAAGLAGLLALRAELAALAPAVPAPAALRQRIEAALPGAPGATAPLDGLAAAVPRGGPRGGGSRPAPRRSGFGWTVRGGVGGFAAGLAVAAMLALAVFAARRGGEETHTLAALADSVQRMEQPAAEPAPPGTGRMAAARWFAHQGLIVPPAPDLAAGGFRFAWYRGERVAGHRAAVLGYLRAGQPITLFAWPSGHGEPAHPPRTARAGGMTVVYWNDGQTEFWAVGKAADTVAAFVAAYRRAA